MPNSAGKLAFPMLLRSRAPSVPWSIRMRPPIRTTVGRTVLWLGLVVRCLFLVAGLGGQVFDSVSSGPYLVPVGSRGNWYDLCLHHLQLPLHNHLTENNSTHHQRLPPPAWHSAFHHFLCVVFLPPARQRRRRLPCCTRGCPPNSESFAIVSSYPLALDQTPLVHRGPPGDEGIFLSTAGVLPTGNPRPLHRGIWRVPQGVRLRPALSSILYNVVASSSLPRLRPTSGQDPLLAPSPRVCILPQSPPAKQPLGVCLRPHICGAPPSRPSLTTSGPQDFAVP